MLFPRQIIGNLSCKVKAEDTVVSMVVDMRKWRCTKGFSCEAM